MWELGLLGPLPPDYIDRGLTRGLVKRALEALADLLLLLGVEIAKRLDPARLRLELISSLSTLFVDQCLIPILSDRLGGSRRIIEPLRVILHHTVAQLLDSALPNPEIVSWLEQIKNCQREIEAFTQYLKSRIEAEELHPGDLLALLRVLAVIGVVDRRMENLVRQIYPALVVLFSRERLDFPAFVSFARVLLAGFEGIPRKLGVLLDIDAATTIEEVWDPVLSVTTDWPKPVRVAVLELFMPPKELLMGQDPSNLEEHKVAAAVTTVASIVGDLTEGTEVVEEAQEAEEAEEAEEVLEAEPVSEEELEEEAVPIPADQRAEAKKKWPSGSLVSRKDVARLKEVYVRDLNRFLDRKRVRAIKVAKDLEKERGARGPAPEGSAEEKAQKTAKERRGELTSKDQIAISVQETETKTYYKITVARIPGGKSNVPQTLLEGKIRREAVKRYLPECELPSLERGATAGHAVFEAPLPK